MGLALLGRHRATGTRCGAALLAAAVAGGAALLLALIAPGGGLGLGDVKLLGLLGLFLGWLGWGVLPSASRSASRSARWPRSGCSALRRAGLKDQLAFGQWLIAGALVAVVAGAPLRGRVLSVGCR